MTGPYRVTARTFSIAVEADPLLGIEVGDTIATIELTPTRPTLTIPDDPQLIALVLCKQHRECRDHIGGHDAYIWQARRLLADLRRLT